MFVAVSGIYWDRQLPYTPCDSISTYWYRTLCLAVKLYITTIIIEEHSLYSLKNSIRFQTYWYKFWMRAKNCIEHFNQLLVCVHFGICLLEYIYAVNSWPFTFLQHHNKFEEWLQNSTIAYTYSIHLYFTTAETFNTFSLASVQLCFKLQSFLELLYARPGLPLGIFFSMFLQVKWPSCQTTMPWTIDS